MNGIEKSRAAATLAAKARMASVLADFRQSQLDAMKRKPAGRIENIRRLREASEGMASRAKELGAT